MMLGLIPYRKFIEWVLMITQLNFKNYCTCGWWFGTFFMFPYIGNVIIPTDLTNIFQRGRSTTNHQSHSGKCCALTEGSFICFQFQRGYLVEGGTLQQFSLYN
jgi:hypothetical protein